MDKLFNTPIAFFVFKRPQETRRVFEIIRNMKPSVLLIVADGPRNDEEKKQTDEVRLLLDNIDWPCEVSRNYSETNLGCKERVSSGLNWVFENVDKAIILEDDCLPDQSFFLFCEEMLEKYKDNEKIMHISGVNMQENKTLQGNGSYYFSRIAQIWGWATWRRAWIKYDVNMSDWPKIKLSKKLDGVLIKPVLVDYFKYLYQRMYNNELSTWDVAWTYACMKEDGICIVPNKNLIENIGFTKDATHSVNNKGNFGNMKTEEMLFPIIHPREIKINDEADEIIYKKVFGIQSRIGQKLLWFFKYNTPKTYKLFKSLFQNIKLLMK